MTELTREEYKVKLGSKMRMYREGFAALPKEYIEYHKGLAEDAFAKLAEHPEVTVHRTFMYGDGWLDGMVVMFAIVEIRRKLIKLHWHDSHASGKIFRNLDSGGSVPFDGPEDI